MLKEAARTLDLDKPVAVMLMGILGHIEDDDEAKAIIGALLSKLPSGSYLAMYDGGDTNPDIVEATRIWNISANPKYHLRSPERIAGLFEGLDVVPPGIVPSSQWRPGSDDAERRARREEATACGVGLKQ